MIVLRPDQIAAHISFLGIVSRMDGPMTRTSDEEVRCSENGDGCDLRQFLHVGYRGNPHEAFLAAAGPAIT